MKLIQLVPDKLMYACELYNIIDHELLGKLEQDTLSVS